MIEPFLKWAGGKRWLMLRYGDHFPIVFERYVEPFLGGGAVFFGLQPERALLSDINGELINAYRVVRDRPEAVDEKLRRLEVAHSKSHYYAIRASKPRTAFGQAVRFIYLNRTCFNGIYRVNRAGEFNVPIGTKTDVAYEPGFLKEVARSLRRARLCVADFEQIIDESREGDFVFVDPPYTVMHNQNNFVKYNASLFSWADQVRLAASIRRARERGAQIVLANADHESVRALYRGFGQLLRVHRSTILAADKGSRRQTTELLVVA